MLSRVMDIVAEVSGSDAATLQPELGLFTDLGIDSAAALEIIVALEDEFDITISSEEAAEVKTLGEVAALVRRLASKK